MDNSAASTRPATRRPTPVRTSAATAAPTPTRAASRPPSAGADGRPLAGRRIALDPGHNRDNARAAQTRRSVDAGGFRKPCNTTGTQAADGYTESRFNLDVALALREGLQRLGATVVMTRTADAGWGPCVDARGRFGAGQDADVTLSIHADGSSTGNYGFHVIRPSVVPGYTDDVAAPSARLATAVRDALVGGGFRPSNYLGERGIDVRGDLGTLNLSDVPVVMVESYNMRNPAEERVMRTPATQQRFAAALARGIADYLG